MSYIGIDLSTHAVDLVKLDEDTYRAEWYRVPLVGESAIDRARSYYEERWKYLKHSYEVEFIWDDVIVCALEDPHGAGRSAVSKIMRVQGVVLATIPARVQVWTFAPGEWRNLCGLAGNASKENVREWALDVWGDPPYPDPPQDACDAYCIAYAARALNERQEEA